MSHSYKFGSLHEFQDQVPTVRPPPGNERMGSAGADAMEGTSATISECHLVTWRSSQVPRLLIDLDDYLCEDCTLAEAYVATHIDGRLSMDELVSFTGLSRELVWAAVTRLHDLDLVDVR